MSLFSSYFTDGGAVVAGPSIAQRGFLKSGIGASFQAIQAAKTKEIGPPTKEQHKKALVAAEEQLEWLEGTNVCLNCNRKFIRKENIGGMKCRWHPNYGPDPEVYACCGRKAGTIGCTPCDHSRISHSWNPGNDTETIPLAVAIHLGISPKHYTVKPSDCYRNAKAIVKRCIY